MDTTASPTDTAIAKLIKAQMAMRGVTQADLSALTGISKSQVNRKLLGKLPFELDDVMAMAEALELDPQKLLTRGIRMAEEDPDHFTILGDAG